MSKANPVIRLLRIIMPIVGVVCCVLFVPRLLVWAWILPLPDTVEEQLDEAIGHGFDGILVYVDEAGKPPAYYSAGWDDREKKTSIKQDALFKIGSISKLYVAVAATKLVNKQMLSLDDTLAQHFPELVDRIEHADKITLRLMLQHRSGMPNYTDHPDYPWDNAPKSSREKLEYGLDLPAIFEPGEDYDYSNTNFLLTREILDKVLGYSHRQYIKEQILIPLGLNHTYSSLTQVDLNDTMSGYNMGYKPGSDDVPDGYYPGWRPNLKTFFYGSMIATAEDVGIFLRALNDGSLLNDSEQAIYSSVYVYQHSGWIPGYLSVARYHKDMDTVVVQFINSSSTKDIFAVSEVVYGRIVRILHQQWVKTR